MRIKFLIYILFSYYSIYGQLEINDTITNNEIYWQEQFRSLYDSDTNLSTIIAIDINQNRENTMANKHLEVYKWLNVYDEKKFKIKVFVINESSSKNNFKVCCDENNEKIECSQSTLFFITRNKSQKDFLFYQTFLRLLITLFRVPLLVNNSSTNSLNAPSPPFFFNTNFTSDLT